VGDGDHEPPQAAPRRGAPLSRIAALAQAAIARARGGGRGTSAPPASPPARLGALLAVSEKILLASSWDSREVYSEIARAATAAVGARTARVWIAVDEEGVLRQHGVAAVDLELERRIAEHAEIAFGQGLVGAVHESGAPVFVLDVQDDPRWLGQRLAREARLHAFAGLPLVVADRVVGVLAIIFGERRHFTESEREVMGLLAGQAALAIHTTRLLGEERMRRAQLAALLEINKTIAAPGAAGALAEQIAEEAARLLDVDNAGVRLVDGDGLVLAGVAGAARETMVRPRLAGGEGLSGRVVAAGRTLAAELPSAEGGVHESWAADRRLGYRWFLGVPLRLGERIIGVLVFRGRRPFAAHQRELAEAFAGQAAIALEHARLFSLETARRTQIEALAVLARRLTETLDVASVGARLVQSVLPLFGADASGLRLLEADGSLRAVEFEGADRDHFRPGDVLAPGVGVAGQAVEEGRPAWTSDILDDPKVVLTQELRETIEAAGYRAFLAVPLRVKGQVIGALTLAYRERRVFTDHEIALLATLADQAALALDNARLHAETELRRREAETVAELASSINAAPLEPERVLHNLAAALARYFDAPYVAVWDLDPCTGRLHRSLTLGPLELDAALPRHLAPGEGLVGRVVADRIPIVWEAAGDDGGAALPACGLRHVLVYPIAVGDRVLGAFTMNRAAPPAASAQGDAVLASIAAQAALALDHARLYTETTRRLEQTRALLGVVEILNSTLERPQLLKQVAIRIAQVCGVDRCSLERLQDGRLVPLMSQFADGHHDPAMWSVFNSLPAYLPADVPVQARALETRAPAIIADATTSDELPRQWVEAFGHKSYMVVPIMRHDEMVGLMTLDHVRQVTPFEPWQVDLAQAIAGQLALSLENTRLFAEAQERLQETSALLAVGQALSQPAPLAEQLRRVGRAMGQAFGADMVGVYAFDDGWEQLRPLAGWHVPAPLRQLFLDHPIAVARQPVLREAWRSGRAVGSGDPQNDERFDQAWARLFPPHSVLLVPTRAHGEDIGALFLVWWTTGREFSPAETRLVEGIADQVGLALENAELARQREIKLQETETLLSVSRALSTTLDLDALLRQLLRRLASTVGADTVGALRLAEDGTTLLPWAGYRVPIDRLENLRQELRLSIADQAFYAEAARTHRPVFSPDVTADARVPAIVHRLLPHRSQLFVPILAKDRLIGGFVAFWRERAGGFSPGDLALMEAIAHQAGAAVDNARLFEDRTRAYEQLSAAQDHLVRTEKLRALGEMASGVAHDFNNLLAAILGRAQLLLRRLADPELRQWAQVIERSALDGAQTIRRLQEFARVRRDAPMVPVDLNEVVRGALEITQARWREDALRRGVTVEVRTALGAVPTIAGDAAELREAMTNLILNAVDAMPRGGALTITTALTGADGAADRTVEVTIADTGVGIAEHVRERIFDPFFTTKGPQGTGLGLSMTYGIVSRFRGQIAVESEEGRGSTFRLSFPAASAAVASPPSPRPGPGDAGRLRCLVVDDEAMVGAVIGDVLDALGHEAVVVTDGRAAIERFAAEPFDVVFTDLAMPGVSGWQVAAAIRAQGRHGAPARAPVSIFVVTGFGVEIPTTEQATHGVDRVFAKPLRIQDVADALEWVLRRRAERPHPAPSP
jgi:GAF domain-containing protein/ActR/RegA family two-component response regulator